MSDYCCIIYILFISLIVCSFTSVSGNIHKKLHYFETLKSSDIHVISKRSIDTNPQSHLKFVHLKGLGRNFDFYLRSSQDVLSSDFQATIVDGEGRESPLVVNKDAFYKGAMQNEDNSHVEAVWEGDNLLATITTPDEVYSVEPSWRHIPDSKNHSMIIYKGSDVISFYNKTNQTNQLFCGSQPGVTLSKEEYEKSVLMTDLYRQSHLKNSSFKYQEDPDTSHHRKRRSILKYDTCDLIIVADYRFTKGIGNGDSLNTANYLIHILSKVDHVYRHTVWNEALDLKNLGLKIRHVKIHSQYSKSHDYNEERDWSYKELLMTFSWNVKFSDYCLAHLFTYQRFKDGVLGLAYIASNRLNAVGGICSTLYYQGQDFLSLNTGWSSSMNTHGSRILTQEAQIVTTHEIGHNWGSEHDPGEGICAPSSFEHGKYIMYPYAVTGYESNNWKFSPCSKDFISKVLLAKSNLCFSNGIRFNFCGNGKIDKDRAEECDIGFLVNTNIDKCCTDKCVFNPGAECSPVNHECCTKECKVAPKGILCRSVIGDATDCLLNSSCTGQDFSCPKQLFKQDDIDCLDGGKCLQGVCLSFCEARSLKSCICDNVTDACLRCCFGPDRKCKPYDKQTILPNGRPCVQGYCVEGVCKKVVRNVVQRLFDIFEKIMTNDFGEFMKTNIVTMVIIFSMFIWIPLSCLISYHDRTYANDRKSQNEWSHPSNKSFTASTSQMKRDQMSDAATYQINPNESAPVSNARPFYPPQEFLERETTL